MNDSNRLLKLFLCAAFAIAALLVASVTALASTDEDPEAWKYNLGDSKNNATATVTHDSRFEGWDVLKGVDVSKWQGDINWQKVATDEIEFAIIRAGYRGTAEGTLYVDPYYNTNAKNAIANGVNVGLYVFSQAITKAEAVAEAKLAIKQAEKYEITLPLVIDYEYSGANGTGGRLFAAGLTRTERTEICAAFCKTVEAAGYDAMVYANKWMLNDQLNATVLAEKYEIWLANYTSKTTYTGDYSYWQYSASGKVNGINGNADMNFHYVCPGWQRTDAGWCYIRNGERLIGLQTLEGYRRGGGSGQNQYYFDENGELCRGFVKIEREWRYFCENGTNPQKSVAGQMLKNWYVDSPPDGYISPSERAVINSGKIRAYRYCFDETGRLYMGWYCNELTNQKWKYFGEAGSSPKTSTLGRMRAYGTAQCAGGGDGVLRTYFFSSSGVMFIGSNAAGCFDTSGTSPKSDLLGSLIK